jgi:hypothetical protein
LQRDEKGLQDFSSFGRALDSAVQQFNMSCAEQMALDPWMGGEGGKQFTEAKQQLQFRAEDTEKKFEWEVEVACKPERPDLSWLFCDRSFASMALSATLSDYVLQHSSIPTVFSVFNGQSSVSVADFVNALIDLLEYLDCDKETLITALAYVRRIVAQQLLPLCDANLFRLLLASVLAAIKYHDDVGIKNSQYAKLVGLSTCDVKCLEAGFVSLLHFGLFVPTEEFTHTLDDIRAAVRTAAGVTTA